MKHLILGSSGQIGTHLTQFLKSKQVEVLEFDIVNSKFEDLRVTNNILLEKLIDECEFVHFLAFDVGGSRYLKQYQKSYQFLENNVRLMDNTFSLLEKYKKPFIFASSQMSNMDYSSYGTLKRLGEYYTETLNGLTVKFWNVYGIEHDLEKSHVITDFIKKALQNKKIDMLTDGKEERQFLHADDCSDALYALSQKFDELDKSKDYHITSFEWATILNVADLIKEKIPCDVIPAKSADEIQMNKRNEPNSFVLKYWKPKIDLRQGIHKLCDFYRKEIL